MRIIHFIKWLRLRDGGTVRAVLDMCEGLAARGHEVFTVSADDSGVPASWKTASIPSRTDSKVNLPRNLLLTLRDPLWERGGRTMADATRDTLTQFLSTESMREARHLLKSSDVLHVHGVWANSNHQMVRTARALKMPHIISPHGMLDDWSMAQGRFKKRLFLSLIGRRALESARMVHCTARAELDQASKHFPKGRGTVVPLLFDTAPFHSLPGPQLARSRFPMLEGGAPIVLFLSRLHHKKGVEALLHAAALLHTQGTPITLVLAGPSDPPGYLHHLQQLAADLNIAADTHFIGMVTGSDKWSLYQAADLFVLPTCQENFGYVLFEALACGTPVITTRGVDIWPELLASGGADICDFPTSSAAAPALLLARELAPRMKALLGNAPRRSTMSIQGRAWALSFLDRDKTLDAMEAMYRGEA